MGISERITLPRHTARIGAVALTAGALVVAGTTATIAWAGDRPGPAGQSDTVVAMAAPVFQPDTELRFVPLTSCKVADTRVTGKLGKKGTRTFVVAGTALTDQGGPAAGCGIPSGASAAALTLVATGAKKPGYLRAGPSGSTPAQIVVGYQKKTPSTGGMTIPLISPTSGVALANKGGPTNVSVWVTGYYEKPLAAFIASTGSPYSGSSRILSATHVATGVYEVQFDRNVRYCTATATSYVSAYFASASTWFDSTRPDTVRVFLWNASGAAVDQYFYLSVEC